MKDLNTKEISQDEKSKDESIKNSKEQRNIISNETETEEYRKTRELGEKIYRTYKSM